MRYDWVGGSILKERTGLSERNARRLAKKLNRDITNGGDTQYMGRKSEKQEGKKRNCSFL